MANKKLVGENYSTPELRAKVTGRSKYAEDFRAEGMLFARLLLSPYAHARIRSIDASAALAMPGVKAILTGDDVPGPKDQINDNGTIIRANPRSETALANEAMYQGQPVLAVCAVSELTSLPKRSNKSRFGGSRCRSTSILWRRWCRARRIRALKATSGNAPGRPLRGNRLAFPSPST